MVQGGLEVPCRLILNGSKEEIGKIKKLLALQVSKTESQDETVEKKLKVEDDVCDNGDAHESTCWIKCGLFNLSIADKNVLITGDWVSDKHINFAQYLLKQQFPDLTGFVSTITISKATIQVIHCRSNHWIVASDIKCNHSEIVVYDSL